MKHKTRTKALSWLLSLALFVGLLPGMSIPALASESVQYLDASGVLQTCTEYTIVTDDTTTWGTAGENRWYVFNNSDDDFQIFSRVTVQGNVHLILCNNTQLTACRGITVGEGNSLTIYAQSTDDSMGKLIANGSDGAGIGGGEVFDFDKGMPVFFKCGTITINGGKVTANGSSGCAGIGGGAKEAEDAVGNGGTIIINGGDVTATGGNGDTRGTYPAAGIGGGTLIVPNDDGVTIMGGAGGTVTINGGKVTANGGGTRIDNRDDLEKEWYSAPGIGGGYGYKGSDGTVTINGGDVTASAGGLVNPDGQLILSGGAYGAPGISGSLTLASNMAVSAGERSEKDSLVTEASTWKHSESWVRISNAFPILYVGGVQVTKDNLSGMGWSFSPDTCTLTLTDYSYTGEGYKFYDGSDSSKAGIYYDGVLPLTLRLDGTNAIDCKNEDVDEKYDRRQSFAINSPRDVIIEGSGTLTATGTGTRQERPFGTAAGIYVRNLTVESGDVTCISKVDGFVGYPLQVLDTLTVNGGKLTLQDENTSVIYNTTGVVAAHIKLNGGELSVNAKTGSGYQQAVGVVCRGVSLTVQLGESFSYVYDPGTFEINGGSAEITATGAAVELTNATMTLGDVIMYYGDNADGAARYTADEDEAYETIREIRPDEQHPNGQEGKKYVRFATPPEINAPVTLTVVGNDGTTCKASLLDSDFSTKSSLTKKAGDQFILSVNRDAGFDYEITLTPGKSRSAYLTRFQKGEYQQYSEYCKENHISVPANTDIYWVTMPGVLEDGLNITVTFMKERTFTVLYQPKEGTPPETVWCKIEKNTGEVFTAEMNTDAALDDVTVWSAKMISTTLPKKIAFVTAENKLAEAELSDVAESSIKKEAQGETVWTTISRNENEGKYVVIGGNAKTAIAAFVTDASALPFYDSDTMAVSNAASTTSVTYRIAVCETEDGNVTTAGTVTAPAAPTGDAVPMGKSFEGWSVLEGTAPDKTVTPKSAGDPISIKENTIVSAVWKPAELTVTLNLNGGTGITETTRKVTYDNTLPDLGRPTKAGYSFDGWTVAKAVTEDGKLFAKGTSFDLSTPITADLELTAQWKHVHSYSCYQLKDLDWLSDYLDYAPKFHIGICSCEDMILEAHSFDSNGVCTACGYNRNNPGEQTVKLQITYGQWDGNTYRMIMAEPDRNLAPKQETSVYAPSAIGNLVFSKWQYSADGTTWRDFTANMGASFTISRSMTLRALYVNPIQSPQVELRAESYDYPYGDYNVGTVLYHMDYKLPDGCSVVDAGVRMGDNAGISYYEIIERPYDTTSKALYGVTKFADAFFGGSFIEASYDVATNVNTKEKFYEKRENSVLDEINAVKLAEYMYESKPINVEIYPPVYWGAKVATKGMSGSLNTIAPLSFINKNNGNHYIYAIAYLRYKDTDGNIQTIYTEALPTTLNNIPNYTVKATPTEKTNTKTT